MEAVEIAAEQFKINEERQRTILAQRKLWDDTKGDLSAEQREQWDRMEADITRLNRKRDDFGALNRNEAEAAAMREANLSQYGETRVAKAEYNESQALRDWLKGIKEGRHVEFPIDVHRGGHQVRAMREGMTVEEARALAWDTGSIASGVPTTTAAKLYQKMEATIACFKMPFTRITTSSGEQMKFPKVNAHGIATQVSGQGTTLAGTDPTFLSTTLDAYKYAELVIVASEVVSDTSFDITGFVTSNIARAVGRKIDVDIMGGSGSGLPQGVMTGITGAGTIASGGTIVTNGGNGIPSYEKYIDLQYSVNDAYRSNGAAWLMHDLTAGQARKLRDGAGGTVGAVLWLPSLTEGIQGGQPSSFLGYPVYTDPNVASLASNSVSIWFGDPTGYYLRTVGAIALDADSSRYFDTDQVGFRAKWRVDGDYVDSSAANIMKISV